MKTGSEKRTAANGIYMRVFTFHLPAFISLQMDRGRDMRNRVRTDETNYFWN